MNAIGMMRPKYSTTYLGAEDTLRDGLDIMKKSGYMAVPVIDREKILTLRPLMVTL